MHTKPLVIYKTECANLCQKSRDEYLKYVNQYFVLCKVDMKTVL